MRIEQEENLIKYNDAEIWLYPLTGRVMIEQLQKIQKLQEEV